jgi:hypothetical protein
VRKDILQTVGFITSFVHITAALATSSSDGNPLFERLWQIDPWKWVATVRTLFSLGNK